MLLFGISRTFITSLHRILNIFLSVGFVDTDEPSPGRTQRINGKWRLGSGDLGSGDLVNGNIDFNDGFVGFSQIQYLSYATIW